MYHIISSFEVDTAEKVNLVSYLLVKNLIFWLRHMIFILIRTFPDSWQENQFYVYFAQWMCARKPQCNPVPIVAHAVFCQFWSCQKPTTSQKCRFRVKTWWRTFTSSSSMHDNAGLCWHFFLHARMAKVLKVVYPHWVCGLSTRGRCA